jgi:hypothetical protein
MEEENKSTSVLRNTTAGLTQLPINGHGRLRSLDRLRPATVRKAARMTKMHVDSEGVYIAKVRLISGKY